LITGREGTTATHGDAMPEGERPPGIASLDDERVTTAAHVTAGVVQYFEVPKTSARTATSCGS